MIYTAENGGIKQEVFLYWPPTKVDYKNVFTDDAREFFFKLDGKNIYPNPQGPNGLGQTVAMWLVDRNTLYRERATKGVVDERVMYRVSPDGKTLVWTNLNADGNSGHQVWDRIRAAPAIVLFPLTTNLEWHVVRRRNVRRATDAIPRLRR